MKTSCYNVSSKRDIKKLYNSQRFPKYPNNFIGDTCQVRVNADDYLINDEFIIKSKYKILPKKIYIFGKKNVRRKKWI